MKKFATVTGIAILATGITAQADAKEHKVSQGESLWSIADKYDTTVERIKKINKLDSDIIFPNQKLEVLVKGKYEVQKGDTLEKIAKKFDAKVADLKKWNKIKSNKDLKAGKMIIVDKEEKQVVTQTAAQTPVSVQPVAAKAAPVVQAPEHATEHTQVQQAPVQQVQQAAPSQPVVQQTAARQQAPVQQAPVQQAPVQQAPVQQAAAPAGNSAMDAHLRVIAQRESGGNPRAVNPAGYYGLFQFSPSTWASVGGTGNPANASVEEQWKRARILYQTAGASQWSTAY
ncbi:LysM peptidoglycan-binding domain-containing protein [Macrococcus armenti]|uniref:LysM peptidoglycan-binding domain-containing protein n=1 Tax=Macrococcus armenti TaxID=2875764 RepID=UPI0024344368|nr:LysM peptidoglycan-binding domain-containing protein [Macrococcus armenti]